MCGGMLRALFIIFVLGLAGGPSYAYENVLKQAVSDEQIRRDVIEKIENAFDKDQIDVQVTVINGDVVLDGWMAEGRYDFILASIINSVDGVRSIQNNAYVDLLRSKDY